MSVEIGKIADMSLLVPLPPRDLVLVATPLVFWDCTSFEWGSGLFWNPNSSGSLLRGSNPKDLGLRVVLPEPEMLARMFQHRSAAKIATCSLVA